MIKASDIVKKWGSLTISENKTIREYLTVEGMSLWDILAPSITLFYLPNALSKSNCSRSIGLVIVDLLKKIKYIINRKFYWITQNMDSSDCARWPSGEVVLFLAFSPYLARDILLPVAEMIGDESEIKSVMLLDQNDNYFENRNIFSHSIKRHKGKDVASDSRKFSKNAKKIFYELINNNFFKRICNGENAQLEKIMRLNVLNDCTIHLPGIIAAARHILTEHRPSIIVSIDVADPRTRVFTQMAKSMAIPTLQVQAGPIAQGCVEWRFLQDDMVAIQEISTREDLIFHGVPIEKIVVTGSPRYEGLVNATPIDIINMRKRFNIPSENKVIVLASTYCLDAFGPEVVSTLWTMKCALFKAVEATSGVSLIVKPHPIENCSQAQVYCAKMKSIYFALSNESITDFTRACDVFLSFGSTATFEALILEKTTACLGFQGWDLGRPFLGSGAVIELLSESDIIHLLSEVLKDGGFAMMNKTEIERRDFLNRMIGKGRHGATQRILELIKSMISPTTTF